NFSFFHFRFSFLPLTFTLSLTTLCTVSPSPPPPHHEPRDKGVYPQDYRGRQDCRSLWLYPIRDLPRIHPVIFFLYAHHSADFRRPPQDNIFRTLPSGHCFRAHRLHNRYCRIQHDTKEQQPPCNLSILWTDGFLTLSALKKHRGRDERGGGEELGSGV
ncbi:MAG: hypothetical protein J3Q66DRAFT_51336, partial [Benniella sp.]